MWTHRLAARDPCRTRHAACTLRIPPQIASKEAEMTSDPHRAISQELLIRYLDAWLPATLHGHKRVTYVDTGPESAAAAARVVAEFSDVLARHTVTMVVGGTERADEVHERPPDGLTVVATTGPLLTALRDAKALNTPMFGWLRWPVPGELLSTVAGGKAAEVVLIGAEAAAESLLTKAGLSRLARVDLVDAEGEAERLCFATATEKSLEKFKDELWALDEYGGIRLRDPHDPDGALLDISVSPQLGPLRRALLAQVEATGGATVAELRSWTLHETVYRVADATKAIQALIASGMVSRTPPGGRLSAETTIAPPPQPAAPGEPMDAEDE
jgi:hypothetical protein